MFFNTKKEYMCNLVVALKSSSIDIQVVKVSGTANKKEVIFSQQVPIFLENSEDAQKYTEQYFLTIKNFFKENSILLKKTAQGKINSVQFILYSPWFTSKIESLVHKENTYINEEFVKQKLKEIKNEENLKIIERRVIKLEANGYTLFDIKKIKYPEIRLTTYVSYISKELYKNITGLVEENFPETKEFYFVTSPLMVLQQIKKFMINEDNIVFLNIGEEITEIGVIQDDTLSYFVTFPKGIHDFLRVIQTNIRSYDYDVLYQKEILLKSQEQISRISEVKDLWIAYLSQSVGLFSIHVPNKLVILTHKKVENFFIDILQSSIKEGKIKGLENHRIINFDISYLKDIIEFKTPLGENSIDLVLEALI